ncbi:MAG: FAD-dependent oxidoreductase [Hyphomicrobiales bacterium]
MPRYQYQPFEVLAPPELMEEVNAPAKYAVAIIGAGPIGLSAAIDLATHGIASVVLDDNNVVSVGSRAICWAKRSLEIFDRLGVGERMLAKGVTWQTGRLFHKDSEVYNFDLLPEDGHKFPAFINLQQYYVEQYLVERALEFPELIDLRFKNCVKDHKDLGEHVDLTIETPFGAYEVKAEYVLACDGAGSPTRKRMHLPFEGQTFEEHFLIVDVEMDENPFETDIPERWFWFEPDFHNGQSALLHKQPDNIYRIDLQLGPEADPKTEATDEKVLPRIKAIVGDKSFQLDWKSVYKFRCAKLDRFVHNRVIFVGDSAHVVSPFGARGGNGGIQDVDNLCWKLAAVLTKTAPETLLETYNTERGYGADENILNSSRATNFMTPKSAIESIFRNEVLRLSKDFPFARRLINSGRLSLPCTLPEGAKEIGADTSDETCISIGETVVDVPLDEAGTQKWLSSEIQNSFTLVGFGDVDLPNVSGVKRIGISQHSDHYPVFQDVEGFGVQRYGLGKAYLFRPDGYLLASFQAPTHNSVANVVSDVLQSKLLRETPNE